MFPTLSRSSARVVLARTATQKGTLNGCLLRGGDKRTRTVHLLNAIHIENAAFITRARGKTAEKCRRKSSLFSLIAMLPAGVFLLPARGDKLTAGRRGKARPLTVSGYGVKPHKQPPQTPDRPRGRKAPNGREKGKPAPLSFNSRIAPCRGAHPQRVRGFTRRAKQGIKIW